MLMQACRWALIGNAVTVPVAKWLGERLMNPCSHKYYVGQKDCKLDAETALNHQVAAMTTDPGLPE